MQAGRQFSFRKYEIIAVPKKMKAEENVKKSFFFFSFPFVKIKRRKEMLRGEIKKRGRKGKKRERERMKTKGKLAQPLFGDSCCKSSSSSCVTLIDFVASYHDDH